MPTLKEDSIDDIDTMLSADDFGQSVTFKPEAGSEIELNAIFDEEPERVIGDGDMAYIQSQQKVLWIKLADIGSEPNTWKDIFDVDGTEYRVTNVENDGTGLLVVYLNQKTN